MTENTLTGIVMCGGKSIRMGSDKGLLLKDNSTWAELAYKKLLSILLPVKLSINTNQLENYKVLFNKDSFIQDFVNIPGPLAGIFSCHEQLKHQDLLVIACDMTDITERTLQQLIQEYKSKKELHDFFVFRNDEALEPMLGIYTAKGLDKIATLHKKGQLEKFSMKYILETGNTYSIKLEENQKKEFKNYNTSTDL